MLVKTLPANEACVDLRTTDAGDLASAPWREASPSPPPSHAPSTLTASPPVDEPTGSTNAFGMDWRAAGWVSYLRDGKAGGGGHARSTAMPRAPHSAHHAVRRLWCFFAMSALSTKRRWGAQYVGWGEGGLAPVAHLVAMSGCVPRRPPQHGKSCLRTWRTARRSVWRTQPHTQEKRERGSERTGTNKLKDGGGEETAWCWLSAAAAGKKGASVPLWMSHKGMAHSKPDSAAHTCTCTHKRERALARVEGMSGGLEEKWMGWEQPPFAHCSEKRPASWEALLVSQRAPHTHCEPRGAHASRASMVSRRNCRCARGPSWHRMDVRVCVRASCESSFWASRGIRQSSTRRVESSVKKGP